MIREFGILNTKIAADHKRFGVPFPGTFVLDAQGHVTARMFEESYRTRRTGASLVLQVDTTRALRQGTSLHTADGRVQVAVAISDSSVAPGQEVTVVFDVQAQDGVHVYAPGDHSYRAFGLQLAEDSEFTLRETVYPETRILHFAPLNEDVPVFEGSFRIQQAVVLEASRELATRAREAGAQVTLRGALELQACDDAVCFLPDTLPLEFTLELEPFESK